MSGRVHRHAAESAAPGGLRPPATGAATAPGLGEVIGWVDDRPVPRAHLDRRIAELRDGPLSAALPVPGTSEDRQLSRWLTQVILTEVLCETTARALGLTPLEGPPLDRLAAVELGSINAAAYNGSPWVRAVFQHVTARTEIPPQWRPRASPERSPGHLIRYRLFADRRSADQAGPGDLQSLGRVELGSLPTALAEAIQVQPYGTLVGPVRDALGWHLAIATPAEPAPSSRAASSNAPVDGRTATSTDRPITTSSIGGAVPSPEEDLIRPPEPAAWAPLLEAARRRAFARRLDEMRAEKVELVPGLEHPGDPRQPDNNHKH